MYCRLIVSIIYLTLTTLTCALGPQIVFPGEDNEDDNRKDEDNITDNYKRSCTILQGGLGECISIVNCKSISMKDLNSERYLAIIRKNLCGFEDHVPKVCCPFGKDASSMPRPRPSITTREPERFLSTRKPEKLIVSTFSPNPGRIKNHELQMLPSLPETCGIGKQAETRIVGGMPAKIGAWPWMAALMFEENGVKTPQCGATLVSDQIVLTAAHCVYESERYRDPTELTVRLGEHNIQVESPDDSVQDYQVKTIIGHPKFDPKTYKNDIAILKLKSKVTFSERISPICLPYDSHLIRYGNLTGNSATITGWGRTSFNGPSSEILQETSLEIVSQEYCKKAFEKWVIISDVYICASNMGSTKDSCQGDSGGPLVLFDRELNRWYLIGIVSFGRKCATPSYPGVYSRISMFLNWIENNI